MRLFYDIHTDSFKYKSLRFMWYLCMSIWAVYSASMRDKINVHASSCTYYFLVSMVPIVIVASWAASVILADRNVGMFLESIPLYLMIMEYLSSMDVNIPQYTFRSMGIFGIAYSLWCASKLVRGVAGGFTTVFGTKGTKKAFLVAMSAYFFVPVLLVLTLILALMSSVVTDVARWFLSDVLHIASKATLAAFITSLAGGIFVIMGIYAAFMLLAAKRPKTYAALIGACFFGLYFYVLQNAVMRASAKLFENYSIYGALGTLILMLLWAFLIFFGLFAAAELAAVLSNYQRDLFAKYLYTNLKEKPSILDKFMMDSLPFAGRLYLSHIAKNRQTELKGAIVIVKKGEILTASGDTLGEGKYKLIPAKGLSVTAMEDSYILIASDDKLHELFKAYPDMLGSINPLRAADSR